MSNQRTDIPRQAPLAQFQPHKAESYIFALVLPQNNAGAAAVVQGPNFRLPAGAQVSVRPTGPNGVNSAVAFMATQYESALHTGFGGLAGPVAIIPPAADVVVPWVVENLNELWFTSGAQGQAQAINIVVLVSAVR